MIVRVYDEKKNKEIVAGEIKDGIFTKNVERNKHYLRVVGGYAISNDAIEKIINICNEIRIIEKDTGNSYRIPFGAFMQNSKGWSHGHGNQKTISEKYLSKI